MNHTTFIALSTLLPLAIRAAVPVEWAADIDNPAAKPIAVGFGETVRLAARLVRRGAPYDPGIATAALYLQTNGMGRTWLTAPATVASNELSALYTPAMMGGAPVVSAFLGGRDADGGVYRAFAILRTYHAPGALPGAMPPEAPADLDFSAFTYINAPWTTPEVVDAAIADAIADATNDLVVAESDPLFSAWVATNDWSAGGGGIDIETDPVFGEWAATNTIHSRIDNLSNTVNDDYQLLLIVSNRTAAATIKANNASNAAARAMSAAESALDEAKAYTTNYYAISSLGRIFVTTNGYLYVEKRDTPTNAWDEAWSSYAMQTNAAHVFGRMDALEAGYRATTNAAALSGSNWATYDAQGNRNPTTDTILMNRAYATIGSGFYWASSGGYYCLASSGTVAYSAVAEGSWRLFSSSVSNYVGIVSGEQITVGCNATGFSVVNGTANITYPYSGGDHPVIYGSASCIGPWTEMSSPVWTDNANDTATASFPADQTHFFFKATTTAALSEYWRAVMPTYLEGGIKTSAADQNPVVYDSKITITSGGHTYRIPAQLVE